MSAVITTDETLIIETPERVPLHFALASIGNRFIACAIDHAIQVVTLISLVILAMMMVVYQIVPTWRLLAIIPLTGIAFLAAFGAGLWLAALNVEYRDFRYVLPFIVQFGLYASPVGFSSSVVPEKWRLLYSLNPMVGVIDGFRWSVTGVSSFFYWPGFLASLTLVFLIAIGGVWYFRKTERAFADVI